MSGEVNAAIAMALAFYTGLNIMIMRKQCLTIKKVARTYSPWSSKIYTLRRAPR
jgi:hypothetical protein